nr:MAG TPA: hypothetical protein [Caudoviricetes sp.]
MLLCSYKTVLLQKNSQFTIHILHFTLHILHFTLHILVYSEWFIGWLVMIYLHYDSKKKKAPKKKSSKKSKK